MTVIIGSPVSNLAFSVLSLITCPRNTATLILHNFIYPLTCCFQPYSLSETSLTHFPTSKVIFLL